MELLHVTNNCKSFFVQDRIVFFLAGFKLREYNAIGRSTPSIRCERTQPTPLVEASHASTNCFD